MSLVEQQGARELMTASGKLRLLSAAPLIASARQFVFPMNVPGEEEALHRGSVFVEANPTSGGTFLAQCAFGFSGSGIAQGLWASPVAGEAYVAAGGYVYALNFAEPERTLLLPLRPVVGVVADASSQRILFVGYHSLLVCEASGERWSSDRISWEGIAIHALENGLLRGRGWDMLADADVPFTLDLTTRVLTGGGYRQG